MIRKKIRKEYDSLARHRKDTCSVSWTKDKKQTTQYADC